jgi:hypothetical protein
MPEELIDWDWFFREKGVVRGTIAEPPETATILWWNAAGDIVGEWKCASLEEANERLARYQPRGGPIVDPASFRIDKPGG